VLNFVRAADTYYGAPDSLIELPILGEKWPKINPKNRWKTSNNITVGARIETCK